MSKRLLLTLLLVLSTAALGVSGLLGRSVERAWRSEQEEPGRAPEPAAGFRAGFSMKRACAEPRVAAVAGACAIGAYDELLRRFTVPVGLLGVLWVAIVQGIRLAARGSRTLLLRLFVPGLLVTQVVAAALIVATASVAIAPVALLATTFGGPGAGKAALVLGLLAFTALGGILALVKAWRSVRRSRSALVVGRAVAEEEAPALWRVVREVCLGAGARPPDHLVLGLEPNFFVTESPVRCVDGALAGRTMFVSLPLCRILRLDEARAILGHELTHFSGLDARLGRRVLPVYRGAAVAFHGLASAGADGAAALAVLPAASLLSSFLDAFAAVERDLRRERELLADRGGARAASAAAMSAALVKVHAFADAWSAATQAMAEALRAERSCENASALFADLVVASASPEHLAGLDERRAAHPTDSHPPLAVRLENLGTSLAEVAERALDVDPADPAIAVVDASDRLERELSVVEQVLLARRLGVEVGRGASA